MRVVFSGSSTITMDAVERSILWGNHQLALRRALWTADAGDKVAAMIQLLMRRLRKGTASKRDLLVAANVHRDGTHETFSRALLALTRSGEVVEIGQNRRGNMVFALDSDDVEVIHD